MASSASAPSPNPPLSPQDDDDDNEPHHTHTHTHQDSRRRREKVDRNSSSPPPPLPPLPPLSKRNPQETTTHWRKSKNSKRNHRTLPAEPRLSNHNSPSSPSSSSSSEDEEEERRRQRQRRSLSRLRKTNRITSTSSTSITSITRNKKLPPGGGGGGVPPESKISPPPPPPYPHPDLKLDGLSVSFQQTPSFPFIPSYNLQWSEQGGFLSSEIYTFFKSQKFVDVTLISDPVGGDDGGGPNRGIRAHKIILAACSDYFRQLLAESPCKHPVILLKGFSRWELEMLLQFMYRGEVTVETSEQVETLLRAAHVLQIRGLVECLAVQESREGGGMLRTQVGSPPPTGCHNNEEDVKGESGGRESPGLLNLSMGNRGDGPPGLFDGDEGGREIPGRNGPQTAPTAHEPGFSIHQHHHHSQPLDQQRTNPPPSSPPFPRRKQARPRRRSGDFIAQDLRLLLPTTSPTAPPHSPCNNPDVVVPPGSVEVKVESKNNGTHEDILDFTISHHRHHQHQQHQKKRVGDQERFLEGVGQDMTASHFGITPKEWHFPGLGLGSLTPPPKRHCSPIKQEGGSGGGSPLVDPGSHSPPVVERHSRADKFRRSRRGGGSYPMDPMHFNGNGTGIIFKGSPPSPPQFLLNFGNGYPPHQPQSDSESNNPETPPTVFSPPGFPPTSAAGKKKNHGGGGGGGDAGLGGQPWPGLPLGPAPIFGRHRAQHSAPRGGPPRAWSNADLTEALHNVWNKKMTTSQASRIFGIPYNSLLMYVRGKYGKSLKLDLLKKGLDMAMESNAAAAAAAAAGKGSGVNKSKAPPSSGRGSPRSPRSSPSSNNATPPHNNNNTIPPKGSGGGKGIGGGSSSPLGSPASLSLTTLLSQGLGGGGGGGVSSPESLRMASHHHHHHHHHKSPDPNTPLGEMLPPGFNPFSMGGIFGDFPPPFPFPTVAAANAALSHILPPPRPHQLLTSTHRRIPNQNGPTEK